jgi:DNA topoisomerase-1
MKFDGFLKVYMESTDEEQEINLDEETDNAILPPLSVGQKLNLRDMTATERYTRPLARYTEASLVKKLEELGIGRPSTYAPTISTIQNRGYVVKEEREGKSRNYRVLTLKGGQVTADTKTEITGAEKNKLFPTDIGAIVNDFLVQHFKGIVDFNFTATVEKEFDEIAQGLKNWSEMLTSFYHPFHLEVENTTLNAERANGGRELGIDPETGKKISVRIGRYGPFVQIGEASENEEDEKPRYASLRSGQMIETITLDEALDLFKLPFQLEDYEGKEVSVGVGRFGPYVKWGESFISLPKGEDPLSVNLPRAIEIINEKNIADAPIAHFHNLPVTKGKGRFGPFIKWNNLYINVPVRYNFDTLGKAEVEELISKKIEKESNRFIQQWPEDKIAIENGRWGPFIRFGKQMLKLGKNPATDDKYTPEELAVLPLDTVKKLITEQVPDAFTSKAKKTTKKAPAKKR